VVWDVLRNQGFLGMEAKQRMENGISSSLLRADIHLFAILLVLEGDRDMFRVHDITGKREDLLASVMEAKVSNIDDFGTVRASACGVFAQVHHIEECHYGELCSDCWEGVVRGRQSSTAESEEFPQEFGGDVILAMGGGGSRFLNAWKRDYREV
jgi:hypothetical protein